MNNQENEKIIKHVMGILGSRKSEAKAAAARENGKKGGRPRKSDVKKTGGGDEKQEAEHR